MPVLWDAARKHHNHLVIDDSQTLPVFHYSDSIWYHKNVQPPHLEECQSCFCHGSCAWSPNCTCRVRQSEFGLATGLKTFLVTEDGHLRTVDCSDGTQVIEYTNVPIVTCNSKCRCFANCFTRVGQKVLQLCIAF